MCCKSLSEMWVIQKRSRKANRMVFGKVIHDSCFCVTFYFFFYLLFFSFIFIIFSYCLFYFFSFILSHILTRGRDLKWFFAFYRNVYKYIQHKYNGRDERVNLFTARKKSSSSPWGDLVSRARNNHRTCPTA